jgi:diguanylate cyclase (GGDEF)-like protein
MTDTELTADEQARFDALYGAAPAEAQPDSPGVFTGAYKGLAGVPSGLAGAPLSVAGAATGMPSIDAGYLGGLDVDPEQIKKDAQDYFSTTWQYAAHQPIEQLRQSAADYYRPDPQTTGFVGNTLFGATDVLTRVGVGNLIAPGAGMALAAGTTGYERTQDLEAQGVDAQTAQASGALTGASLLASGGLSAVGKTAIVRALTGAGLNAGFGAGTRALDSMILADHGYAAQAEQQRWNDGASIAADLIIGGAFHLLPTREGAKPSADAIDAALTAKAAQGVTDSAPGVPADPKSASAHVAALDTAQAQLVDGQAVAVDPIVRDATFAPRPEAEVGLDDAVRDAMVEAGIPADALDPPSQTHETMTLPGIEPAPYEARLRELRDRRRQGGELTPVEQGELLDLQEQDAHQAKVAGQPIAGVRNMAARAEAERTGQLLPVQVFADADNFKALNDTLGHEAGDVVIRQIGALMARELGEGNVFHRGGDEFVAQGRSESDVTAAMERVRDRLSRLELVADTDTGMVRQKGVGLSYGKGSDVKTAEVDQYADKQRRKAAGLRYDRAEQPARPPAERQPDRAGVGRPGSEAAQHPAGGSERADVAPGRAADTEEGAGAVRADGSAGPAQPRNTAANGAPDDGTRLDPARDGDVALARQIAQENPDLVLDDGTTAADALRAADLDVQEAQRQAEGIGAAVACFLRFGADA